MQDPNRLLLDREPSIQSNDHSQMQHSFHTEHFCYLQYICDNGSYKGVIKREAVYKCTNKEYLYDEAALNWHAFGLNHSI